MDVYEGYEDAPEAVELDGGDDGDVVVPLAPGDAAYLVEGGLSLSAASAGGAGGGAVEEEEAAIDSVVLKFLGNFHRAVREQNTGEIQAIYESTWNALTERFYSKSAWPSGNAVAAHINDDGKGGNERGTEGTRERGNEGTRERGRGNEGTRERGTESGRKDEGWGPGWKEGGRQCLSSTNHGTRPAPTFLEIFLLCKPQIRSF